MREKDLEVRESNDGKLFTQEGREFFGTLAMAAGALLGVFGILKFASVKEENVALKTANDDMRKMIGDYHRNGQFYNPVASSVPITPYGYYAPSSPGVSVNSNGYITTGYPSYQNTYTNNGYTTNNTTTGTGYQGGIAQF